MSARLLCSIAVLISGCTGTPGATDASMALADAAVPPFSCEVTDLSSQPFVFSVGAAGPRPPFTFEALRDGKFVLSSIVEYESSPGQVGTVGVKRLFEFRGNRFRLTTGLMDGGVNAFAGDLWSVRPGHVMVESFCPVNDVVDHEFSYSDGGRLLISYGRNIDTYEVVE